MRTFKNSLVSALWWPKWEGNPKKRDYMCSFQLLSCFDSLRPHGLQHARPPWTSAIPRVYSNSCPLRLWYHPSISPSVVPFSCLQSFPASGSFITSWHFTSGGQSIGAPASASVLPMNIHDWFPLGWQIWFLCSPRDSREILLQHDSSKT